MRKRVRGFTLMEVLVAISIFALIGVASYRVLNAVMATNERIAARAEQMRNVNRAFWMLQQDVEQLLQRNARDANGAYAADDNYLLVKNDDAIPLQFTRGGRPNPLGLPRSSMQRVAYAVGSHPDREKTDSPHYHEERMYLLRYTWPMLDGAGGLDKAQVQILLPDIDTMLVSVLTDGNVYSAWPLAGDNEGGEDQQPQALQFEFTFKDGSDLKRSYKIW